MFTTAGAAFFTSGAKPSAISDRVSGTRVSAATGAPVNPGPNPNNKVLRDTAPNEVYAAPDALVPMRAGTISNVGGSQAHLNMQPFLTISFCIALQGIFPSPN